MEITLTVGKSSLAPAWLKLGVASLIAAGIFSLLLVLSRTPGAQDVIPWLDFFHTALVVHVNLSVLIWFMSFSCVFWSLYAHGSFLLLEKLALLLCAAGTALLVVAPFLGAGKPLINNYIPVLQHPLFFWAIGLFAAGVLIQVLRVLTRLPGFRDVGRIAPYIAAVFTLFSILALLLSWRGLAQPLVQQNLDNLVYYEYLFWGGGHILQFSHSTLLLLAWLVLVIYTGGRLPVGRALINWLFALLLLPLFYAIYLYFSIPVFSPEHKTVFTELMKYGGLTSLPLGMLVVYALFTSGLRKNHETAAARAALFASIILFTAGGIIGFLIHGVNVVIPAHYHGSIVGITLAFMGVAYYLLPEFGYRKPVWKIARIQPYVYGGGQLMHVLGLAWSGGYGVQRKTAGAAQGLDSLGEVVGMGMMGLGGLISIIGGILFLVVVIKSMWPQTR